MPMSRLAVMLLPIAALAAMAGCATSGAVPRPFPTPGRGVPAVPAPIPEPAPPDAFPAGESIADTASGLQGVPYRLGGADPLGFDCSGLVQWVLARHGIAAPRVVKDQAEFGRLVRDELRPGDLVFFAVNSRRASHVGIIVDGDRFVHAPATGQAVRVDSVSAPYWRQRYAGARRIALEDVVLSEASRGSN